MKYLIEEQSYMIYRMRKEKRSQQEIAGFIGVSQATISKELFRNCNSLDHYAAKDAEKFSKMRKEHYNKKKEIYCGNGNIYS